MPIDDTKIDELASKSKPTLIRQMSQIAHPSSINLGIGQLMFAPDMAIGDVLQHSRISDYRYPANGGIPELRTAIAQIYGGRAEQAVVTIGVQEAVFDSLFALKKCGASKVLIPDPAFGIYNKISQELGMSVSKYSLGNDFHLDLESLAIVLDTAKPDVVFFNFPGNPTGVSWTDEMQRDVANLLKPTNAFAISDEIYRQLTFVGDVPQSFSNFYDNTIVVDGVSKSGACAGLRVGWAYSNNTNLAKIIEGVSTTVKSCAPTLMQRAALPVVNGTTQPTIDLYKSKLSDNFEMVRFVLNKAGVQIPQSEGGFYTFANLNMPDTEQFCKELAAKDGGVVTIPGKAFGMPSYVRISFASDVVEQGIKRFTDGLTEYRGRK